MAPSGRGGPPPHQQNNHRQQAPMGNPHHPATDPRRELRRPMGRMPNVMNADDLARGMQHMDPFGGNSYLGGYGAPPLPNADGWSSGENSYEEQQRQQQQQQSFPAVGYPTHPEISMSNQYPYQPQPQFDPFMPPPQRQQFNPRATAFVPKAHSGLSAAAAEFVPGGIGGPNFNPASNYRMNPPPQQQVNKPRLSRGGEPPFSWASVSAVDARAMTVHIALQHSFDALSQEPEDVDDVVSGLLKFAPTGLRSVGDVATFVNGLSDKCLSDVSVRNAGAHVLGCLAVSDLLKDGPFAKYLVDMLVRMSREHVDASIAEEDLLCHAKLRNFAMFLAHAYLELRGNSPKPTRVNLRNGLVEILQQIGQRNRDKENYKTISQVMKDAGKALDHDEKADTEGGTTPKMDMLMARIHTLGTDPANTAVSKYIKELMTDVVALRKGGWGEKKVEVPSQYLAAEFGLESAIPPEHQKDFAPYGGMAPHEIPAEYDDYVFNGSGEKGSFEDDNDLTEEELAFMTEQLTVNSNAGRKAQSTTSTSSALSSTTGDASTEGMSAEMEAAYEEFVGALQQQTKPK